MTGRPELIPYIVSVRYVGESWPQIDRGALAKARRDHDEGRTTMCQGRAGNQIIQYSIPTKKPVRRIPYFSQKDY